MLKSKVIRDTIHKDIFLDEAAVEIVDSPVFQRLRHIKQLGVTNLVYPSANHTRFEHSIGAAHIAGRVLKKLDLQDSQELRFAALLHDLGHGPLSHTSEELLERYLETSHEDITLKLIKETEIGDILESHSVDTKKVISILAKRDGLSSLISGEVDVDRMDYLTRDAYHTGVAYGIIDLDRLVNTLEMLDGRLIVGEGGLRAVEGLLVARFLMTPTVYLHHASRIADSMFLRATERAVDNGILEIGSLYRMDDVDMHCLFRCATGYVKDMGRRLDERRLFKTAWRKDAVEMSQEDRDAFIALRTDLKRWNSIEEELSTLAGVEPGYVILDIPPKQKFEESKALIREESEIRRLDEVSPVVKILQEAEKARWSVGIYTLPNRLESVKKASAELEKSL